jgi:hypothetical protein
LDSSTFGNRIGHSICEDCYKLNLGDLSWSGEVGGFGLMCRYYALNEHW